MHKKYLMLTCLIVLMVAFLLSGCAGMQAKPTESSFQTPAITLNHVEVPYYTGYYYIGNKVEVTKGDKGNYGAPMMMAFIFEIENPNKFPVMVDGFSFSILFEDFEVNTVSSPETMWIPAGMTNQLRVPATFDTRQTLLTLLLPGAMKIKEKGVTPWDLLEKWWKGAPDFSFPVSVKEGSAVFNAGGIVKVVPFEAVFP
jgi:LEA14-like dessication related protein